MRQGFRRYAAGIFVVMPQCGVFVDSGRVFVLFPLINLLQFFVRITTILQLTTPERILNLPVVRSLCVRRLLRV